MWCGQCQQDVPAVVSTRGDQRLCCPRCASEIQRDIHELPDFEPDWAVDDWQLEQDLKELDSLVQDLSEQRRTSESISRLDDSHTSHNQSPASLDEACQPAQDIAPERGVSRLGWLLVLAGTGLLVAGGVQVGWAWWSQTPSFFTSGVPLATGGQVLLMMGLLLKLYSEARQRRRQADALQALRQQLDSQRSGLQMEIPLPHRLLANIKAQLDRLEA